MSKNDQLRNTKGYTTLKQKEMILEGLRTGKAKAQIAREANVSRTTVRKYAKKPFLLRLTQEDKKGLRELQTRIVNDSLIIREIIIQEIEKMKDNPKYTNKNINTWINYLDKTNRILKAYRPSKSTHLEILQKSKRQTVKFDNLD